MKGRRVAHYQTLIDGINQLTEKMGIFHHRHLIDKCLMEHILVFFLRGCNALPLISEYLHTGILGCMIEHRHQLLIQYLLEEHFARTAIGNLATIESKDITSILAQFQYSGKCRDTIRTPS